MADDEELTVEIEGEATASDTAKDKPAKKSRTFATLGKVAAFANFVIAILFLVIAFFFHANKLEVNQKLREINQEIGEWTRLQTERQEVVTGLTDEVTAEDQRFANIEKETAKTIGDREAAIQETTERINKAREEQADLNAKAQKLQEDHAALLAEIVELRATYESTLGEEEALSAERMDLADRVAKAANNLAVARARAEELEELEGRLKSAQP